MPSFRFVNPTQVLFGGYNPGTHTTTVRIHMGVESVDPTVVTDVAERVLPGIRADSAEWAGLFNAGTKSLYYAEAIVGTGSHPLSIFIGTADGDRGYLALAFLLGKPESFNIKELIREEAEFRIDGTWMTGSLLYKSVIGTGNSNGTVINFGTITTGTYQGYVHILALNTGTLTAIFESATTATGAYTLHASANIAAANAPTGTMISATGTINAFHRFRLTNTVATATFHVIAGAGRT